MTAVTRYDMTPKQIALVKATVAKDCNDEEFNLFCEVA
ncbi:phage recombination protein Bet, partial [Sinorhizobium medicae]